MEKQSSPAVTDPLAPGNSNRTQQRTRWLKYLSVVSILIGIAIAIALATSFSPLKTLVSTPLDYNNPKSPLYSMCPVLPHVAIFACEAVPEMTVKKLFDTAKSCANGSFDMIDGCARCYCAKVLLFVVEAFPKKELERVIPGGDLQVWSGEDVLKSMLIDRGTHTG